MKNKRIFSFEPVDKLAEQTVSPPLPSSSFMPDWYKEMQPIPTPRRFFEGNLNVSVKGCMPYFDSINAGYMLKTSSEIRFEHTADETINYEMGSEPHVFTMRQSYSAPIPQEYHQVEFSWNVFWQIHTPVGTSTLFVHPLNREDLPFHTTSGIMDTDQNMFVGKGSLPFYVKKGFTGVIPIGTPFAQLIPFQRDSWESRKMDLDEKSQVPRKHRIHRHISGGYRKEIRQHKSWR